MDMQLGYTRSRMRALERTTLALLFSIGLGCTRTPATPPQIDVAVVPANPGSAEVVRDAAAPAPKPQPCALLFEHFLTSPDRKTLQLTRVCFDQGTPKPAELIVEIEPDKMPGIHGVDCVRQDRFLVLEPGIVIDLAARKVVREWKRGTQFVGCEDQRVIMRHWQPVADLEFCDFRSGATGRVEDSSPWRVVMKTRTASEGALSPDGRLVAYMDSKGPRNDALYVVSLDAGPRLIASGFSFAIGLMASPYSSTTPFVWIDASRIVTQRSNGVLVVVHLDGKVEPLVTIPVKTTGAMQPFLRLDPGGRVLFSGNETWIVDVDAKQFRREESKAVGHGFEVAPADAAKGTPLTVLHEGRDVGQIACGRWHAETTRGGVAIDCEQGAGSKVVAWNTGSGAWSTIEQGMRGVIGWVGGF